MVKIFISGQEIFHKFVLIFALLQQRGDCDVSLEFTGILLFGLFIFDGSLQLRFLGDLASDVEGLDGLLEGLGYRTISDGASFLDR